jgi:hypothetical protein
MTVVSFFKLTVMKKLFLLTICGMMCLLSGCLKDKLTHTYTILTPVYKDKTEVYANIKSNPPQEIQSPGKIFIYGNYIFLNEIDKGVHIIDNSNPANPVEKAFIDIPGNLNIAVKGNTLFADLYSDLVTVDISNPLQAKFMKYMPDVFPERIYPNGFSADKTRIITGWIKKDTTVDLKSSSNLIFYDRMLFYSAASSVVPGSASSVPGLSGSMSRFALVNNYLYSINNSTLGTYNISNTNDPQKIATSNIGWNIETIYPFKEKLFIGSSNGMFIYDINNPGSLRLVGQFTHARSCDPVIADDNNAYITLHDGTVCQGFNNQLDVVNVTNLSSPVLVKTYAMTHPYGLTKDNNLLFICDGRDGLKMYDASNPSNIVLKKHITGFETYDAIAWNNNLIVVAKDGLYQYDYSNPETLVQLSKLSLNR